MAFSIIRPAQVCIGVGDLASLLDYFERADMREEASVVFAMLNGAVTFDDFIHAMEVYEGRDRDDRHDD